MESGNDDDWNLDLDWSFKLENINFKIKKFRYYQRISF